MKILHLISTLNPTYGGPVTGLRDMSTYLKLLGHSVEVVTLDKRDSPWLSNFPVKVHPLGPSYLKFGFSFNLVIWLLKNINYYDATIVNGIWQFHGLATFIVFKFSKKPYFLYTHGMLDPWFRKAFPLKHLKKYIYWIFFEYHVLKNARAVIFITEQERLLSRLSFKPFVANEVVINFGISGFNSSSQRSKKLFYERFPSLAHKRCILFLSRIHQKKGCDLLIKAFANVCKSNDRFHLVIVGHDHDGWKSSLEELALNLGVSDNITWTGMVSDDLKWGAFNAAEVFMLPSHSENFGSVVVEALSCGLPVLISNKINIFKEIELYGAGIVKENTIDGSSELLKLWIALSDDDKNKMKLCASLCFKEKFDINNAAINLANYLSKSLQINNIYR